MVKSELIKRSPLRIFEKSIHDGVGKGNIGILAAKKGVGKTACLTHIAVDKLFQDKKVVHVSFASTVDHIISWYEDIFKEIAKKRNLENAIEIHDEIVKNRVIMNFNQDVVSVEQVLTSLGALISDGNFGADTVIFDGYNINEDTSEELDQIRAFAKKLGLEIWFSLSLRDRPEGLFNDKKIPFAVEKLVDKIDVIVNLRHVEDHV
ncbi:MAG TPA: hypothetical protein ENN41_09985, partial [Sediminispirochaeta sp.]|nr:hypothetical protein [Sediminispirochaeta sp.]